MGWSSSVLSLNLRLQLPIVADCLDLYQRRRALVVPYYPLLQIWVGDYCWHSFSWAIILSEAYTCWDNYHCHLHWHIFHLGSHGIASLNLAALSSWHCLFSAASWDFLLRCWAPKNVPTFSCQSELLSLSSPFEGHPQICLQSQSQEFHSEGLWFIPWKITMHFSFQVLGCMTGPSFRLRLEGWVEVRASQLQGCLLVGVAKAESFYRSILPPPLHQVLRFF